jgi:hypothetical protein
MTRKILIEIPPLGILPLDELEFPIASPLLDAFLTMDRVQDIVIGLDIDEGA